MTVRTWLDSLDEPKTKEPEAQLSDAPVEIFDPRKDVSADARYIVRNLVIWFLVIPAVISGLVWALTR